MYTALGYSMYLCGTGVRDRWQLGLGYTWIMRAFAVVTVVAFFLLGVYHAGWRLYQEGPVRGWAMGFLPGWPNYFAFFLGVALLMEAFWWKQAFWTLVLIVAIGMTGSRTGLLAVGICGLGLAANGLRSRRARWPLVIALAVAGGLILERVGGLVLFAAQHHQLVTRLARANDRMAIYRYAWGIFSTHPTIGIGDIVLNQDFGAPGSAFHNSYLEMLVREGVLGFSMWLFLLFPRSRWPTMNRRWAFLALFLIAALFNDIFRNPHSILLYAVLFLGSPESALPES